MKKLLLIVFLSTLTAPVIYAQGCSVCTQTANGLDDKTAKGMNGGIIYLGLIPLTILGTLGFAWWRHNRQQ